MLSDRGGDGQSDAGLTSGVRLEFSRSRRRGFRFFVKVVVVSEMPAAIERRKEYSLDRSSTVCACLSKSSAQAASCM